MAPERSACICRDRVARSQYAVVIGRRELVQPCERSIFLVAFLQYSLKHIIVAEAPPRCIRVDLPFVS